MGITNIDNVLTRETFSQYWILSDGQNCTIRNGGFTLNEQRFWIPSR